MTHVFAPRHGCQYGQAPCCMACMHVPFHVVHDPPEALEGYFGPEETTQTTSCNVGADQREGEWAFARQRNERVGYSISSVNQTDSKTQMKRQARRPLGRYDTRGKPCSLNPCPPDFSLVFEMMPANPEHARLAQCPEYLCQEGLV